MASAPPIGLNVLRYTVLGLGIIYGFRHQSSIYRSQRHEIQKQHEQQEWNKQNELIKNAKAEFVKKTTPNESKNASSKVVENPEDPNFDLEAYIQMKEAGAQ